MSVRRIIRPETAFRKKQFYEIAKDFAGIIVIDEAYIHFSGKKILSESNNKTSRIWSFYKPFQRPGDWAGLRVGLAFADAKIIELFNKVKPPYNVSEIAQDAILEALKNESEAKKMDG